MVIFSNEKANMNKASTRVLVAVGRLGNGVSILAGRMHTTGVDIDGPLCESDARECCASLGSAPWLLARSCWPPARRGSSET